MEQQWKIFLLMDHREFINSKNDFAPRAKVKIDRHFFGKHPLDQANNVASVNGAAEALLDLTMHGTEAGDSNATGSSTASE